MRVMGIDGGVSGAIAVLDGNYGVLEVHDVPTFTIRVGGKERRELDGHDFIDICRRYLDGGFGLDKILFERGQGARDQSAPAAYSYGFTNGRMVGIAEALQIPYELVDPAAWKRALKLLGKTKDDSRKLAKQLFPKVADLFARKGDHGRAEAALIAYFALYRGV